MTVWEIFRRKPRPPQKVTTGRFEIERNGEVAYLEYTLAGNILELAHTEVPEKLRHMGLASSLAETALNWAREPNLTSRHCLRYGSALCGGATRVLRPCYALKWRERWVTGITNRHICVSMISA